MTPWLAAVALAAPAPPAVAGDLAALMIQRGLDPAAVVVAFAADARIEAFAKKVTAASAADTPPATLARSLYDALLALKRSGAIEGDLDNSPKARPPKTAVELMAIAQRTGKGRAAGATQLDRQAGCYELSALYVAAARAVGLDAVGVERVASVGTGQIGHIMAGVRPEAGAPLAIFDLQNETTHVRSGFRELDDLEFAAHHYNHLSVAAFLNGDLDQAQEQIWRALDLAPTNASFINNSATVRAARHQLVEAIADATFAVTLAPRVPLYRYQLGRLHLAAGELAQAIVSFGHALQLRSRYGVARRDLGWALLLSGDAAGARRELERAAREDPGTPQMPLYLGLFHLSQGDGPAARQAAEAGLAKTPDDASLQALVRLAAGGDPSRDDPEVARLRALVANVAPARP